MPTLLNREKIRRHRRADGSERREVNYFVGKSKRLIDEIDRTLAPHYGFTDEEQDFIINYDIKYRMGGGSKCMTFPLISAFSIIPVLSPSFPLARA